MPSPIDVIFRPVGHTEVLSAIKSITQATADAARNRASGSQVYVSASKAEEQALKNQLLQMRIAEMEMKKQEKAIKEQEKAVKELHKAELARARDLQRDVFGNRISESSAERGLRQMSSSKAFEQVFGKTAAQFIGLQGPMGQVTAAMTALKTATSFVTSNLLQLGSAAIRDVIMPNIHMQTTAVQMANRAGVSAAGVKGMITGASAAFPLMDLETIKGAAGTALDKTKSLSQSQAILSLVGKANQAYGFDPAKLTEFIASKRAAFGNMNDASFTNMMANQIVAGKDVGGNFDAFLARSGDIRKIGGYFNTSNQDMAAGNDAAITALLAAGSKEGRSPAQIATGMTQLVKDMQLRPGTFGVGAGATMNLKDLVETAIPKMLSNVGGNLKDKRYTLGLADGAAGTRPLNQTSREFLQALGVDKVFEDAKKANKDAEAEVRKYLQSLIGLNDATKTSAGMAQLDTDAKELEKDAGFQLEQAQRKLQIAMLPLVPVAEQFIGILSGFVNSNAFKDGLDALGKTAAKVALGLIEMYEMLPGSKKVDDKTKDKLRTAAGEHTEQLTYDTNMSGPLAGKMAITDIDRKLYAKSGNMLEDAFASVFVNDDDAVRANKIKVQKQHAEQAAKDSAPSILEFAKAIEAATKAANGMAGKDPARFLGIGSPYRSSP